MKRVVIVGSLNMDMVFSVRNLPHPGETVHAVKTEYSPGGKGANQAVAAARMQVNTAMVGNVGSDGYGRELLDFLNREGMDTEHIRVLEESGTGLAVITVSNEGENSIVLTAGANASLSNQDIDRAEGLIREAAIVLLQLEVPMSTVEYAARMAKEAGAFVVLDPAPAPQEPLPQSLLQHIDVLAPNQHEAEAICGMAVTDIASARHAAERMQASGVKQVLIKLGKLGTLAAVDGQYHHIPSRQIRAVDSTAAGDAFAGGLAAALMHGATILDAVDFANSVGALTAMRPGAMVSIPHLADVERFR